MSDNASANYTARARKRFLRAFLVLVVVLTIIVAPLIVNASLRWDIAHDMGWIPGEHVQKVYDSDSGKTLITIPIHHRVHPTQVEDRFWAAYLGELDGDQYLLTSLDTNEQISLPIGTPTFMAASDDGGFLLLQAEGDTRILLNTMDNSWVQLEPGETPSQAGDWTQSIYATRIGRTCSGVSPNAVYIVCFDQPVLAKYLFGDWQLEVSRYGNYRLNAEIYRGLGSQPVFGFTANDSQLWFQNEEGIWSEPMTLEMFE